MTYDEKLKAPFSLGELEWRVQSAGIHQTTGEWARVLAYVTNRAIMNRLDDVCGFGGWQNKFEAGPDSGVTCGIGIRLEGEWVWRWDGAPNTDIESVKGGLSDAMKRAAVQWGIGRYLYRLEANWAKIAPKGKYTAKGKDRSGNNYYFKWDPPDLPEWALPGEKGDSKLEEIEEEIKQLLRDNESVWGESVVNDIQEEISDIDTLRDMDALGARLRKKVREYELESMKDEKEIF